MPASSNPECQVPRHVAIIMDGNNRWAKRRFLPKMAGHHAAARNLEKVISRAAEAGIRFLTLFAFSTENWNRPPDEVQALMKLLLKSLRDKTRVLDKNDIRLKVIGDRSVLSEELQKTIADSERQTENNQTMILNLAINYGGTWDITQACQTIARQVEAGSLKASEITTDMIEAHLSTAGQPAPDLLIRTSGENRISNFLVWQCAYSEFYFTDTLWPDFDGPELDKAIQAYGKRERRFGKTSDQLQAVS